MNKLLNKLFLGLIIGGITACGGYSSLHTVNLEHRYDGTQPLSVEQVCLDAGENIRLYLAIKAQKITKESDPQTLTQKYSFVGNISNSYKSKYILRRDTLVPQQIFRDREGTFYAIFQIPKIQGLAFGVMALDILEKSTNRDLIIDVPLEFEPANPITNKYALFKVGTLLPQISNYFTTRDTVSVRSLRVRNQTLYVKQYALESFSASLPPMAVSSTTKKSLQFRAKFEIRTDKLLMFNEPGLYFVQEDTTSNNGFGFVVTGNKYPQVSIPEELISPLVYITTRDERSRLSTSKKPKETLDQFWLDIGGNRDHARSIIRNYYENVEEANRLFTDFQEGWKTDRGMVYIIFGKPDRLLRYDDREEWYYDKNANFPDIFFTFVKKPTIFTPDHYEMVRFSEYDRAWYGTVEQWRKGVLRR